VIRSIPSAKRFVLGIVLLLVPEVAGASLLQEANCGDLLPVVLNLGLPQPRDSRTFELEGLRKAAGKLFSSMVRTQGRCHGGRTLQVNIAIGNDYQILDWLGQGLVDVAVVPDLSAYLLARDGVKLLDLNGFENRLTPAFSCRLRSRGYAEGAWTQRPDPERDFESLRRQLWCGLRQENTFQSSCAELARGPEYRIALTSHLSTGGFLRAVAGTAKWLQARLAEAKLSADDGRELANRFWTAFFDHTRFTLDNTLEDDRPGKAAGLIEILADSVFSGPSPGPRYEDHLVITARAAAPIFETRGLQPPDVALPAELKAVLESDPAPAAFRSLLTPEPYFGMRTFGFTVAESIGLLRQHQQTSGKARLAMVLPGGGVKAVYQSRLVDALYRDAYLKNALTRPAPLTSVGPVDVDFVIGTSGGALLGYFVARLAEKGPWNLSQVLWENKQRKVLDSTDIFGWTDLPRYLSVVAILFVFALLLSFFSMALRSIPTDGPPREGVWRTRLFVTVWPLLLLAPLLVRWVNGKSSQEHIPEIEGLFYAICTSLAIFADQCLVLKVGPRPAGRFRGLYALGPALLGGILVALPLLPLWGSASRGRWIEREVSWLNLTRGSLLVCLGVLCLLVGAILWTYASRRYHLDQIGGFRAGFLLSLFVVLGVYGVLALVMSLQPDLLSPLELTLGFWVWLIATSLALGLLVVAVGCRGWLGRWSPFGGLTWLCSHHPNSFVIGRRFFRVACVTLASFVWWNFVLAPGLYGNAHAREFLATAVSRFESEYQVANPGGDPHRLTADLLVPANVLERDGTRYFLVLPSELADCPPVSRKPGSGALWYTYRIRPKGGPSLPPPQGDCLNFSDKPAKAVDDVVFASGSPFPIFPAHLLGLKDKSGQVHKEALVDGGYSNNEPVDAALSVGAEQVLIVESSNPLGPSGTVSGPARWPGLTGPLVADMLRIPGFLFERSQQVDRLSRRGLFVVSLSPWRDEADWPPLFDFRRKVVERLRAVADKDLSRRVGLVESWGPPRFQLSVQVGGGRS
jgi:predicted acylesterase/phospholipase RssA